MLTPKPQPQMQPMSQNPNDRNRQKGTGFTNINRVLGANTGAGEKMGQKIGSSLSNQAGQIKQGIEAGKSQFQQQLGENQSQAQQAVGGAQQAFQNVMSNGTQPEGTDYSKIGEQLRGAAYTGPKNLENAQQLNSQASTAGALGRLGATSAGQGQLLASQVAQRGNYGRGQNALDQLLIGRNGQQAIQQGRSTLRGVEGNVNQAQQMAQQQAQSAAQGVEQNKLAASRQIQEGLSGDQGINTMASKQAQDYSKQAARLQQLIRGTDDKGTPLNVNDISQEDQDLLDNAEQFGAKNVDVYTGNQDEFQRTLGSLAGSIDTNASGKRMYTGNQQQQAMALSQLMGDKGLQSDVQSDTNKYGGNVFQNAFAGENNPTQQGIFGNLGEEKVKQEAQVKHMEGLSGVADMLRRGENPGPKAIENINKELARLGYGAFDANGGVGKSMQQAEGLQQVFRTEAAKEKNKLSQQGGVFEGIKKRLGLPEKKALPSGDLVPKTKLKQKE